jgi:hypothetical protein
MKICVHARLGKADRTVLGDFKARTGRSDSELVRRGLHLVAQEERQRRNAASGR